MNERTGQKLPRTVALSDMEKGSGTNDSELRAYQAARTLSDEEREAEKQQAVLQCQQEHETMLQCMNSAGVLKGNGLCLDEAKLFWKCFREKRGFMQVKFRKWLDEGRPPNS